MFALWKSWDLVASCNPGGSGESHLYTGWADYFRNRHIVILPDNDGPGPEARGGGGHGAVDRGGFHPRGGASRPAAEG